MSCARNEECDNMKKMTSNFPRGFDLKQWWFARVARARVHSMLSRHWVVKKKCSKSAERARFQLPHWFQSIECLCRMPMLWNDNGVLKAVWTCDSMIVFSRPNLTNFENLLQTQTDSGWHRVSLLGASVVFYFRCTVTYFHNLFKLATILATCDACKPWILENKRLLPYLYE